MSGPERATMDQAQPQAPARATPRLLGIYPRVLKLYAEASL